MLGLLMLAREILRGARPSRALAKPSRVRELHYYTGLGDGIISHAEQRNELARDRQPQDGRAPRKRRSPLVCAQRVPVNNR